jgi:CHAD domain-containing protein
VAYRLRKDESVSEGLRRVVTRELRTAAKELKAAGPSEEAIHEARKSIKKVRAVLELMRPDQMGTQLDRKLLRRAGHLLSPLRDADALFDSADTFCDQRRAKLSAQTCSAIRDVLKQHKQRLCTTATLEQAGRRAAKTLDRLRWSAEDWAWKRVGFPAFSRAVQRIYKKARRDMARAQVSKSARDFHQWRKRVKTLWYALRLVEARVGRRRSLADLERLEAFLGEDHDLLTLRTHLDGSGRLRTSERARVGELLDERHAELRRKALSLGERVFKTTPKTFVREFRQQWRNQPKESPRRARQVRHKRPTGRAA